MNVVLLTSDSPWQRALARRIDAMPEVTLTAIVIQEMASTAQMAWIRRNLRKQPRQVVSRVLQRVFYRDALAAIDSEALQRFGENGKAVDWPDVPTTKVRDINSAEAVAAMAQGAPETIAVSGTKLIKQSVFDLAPAHGLVNLHTGISPFYKGGPNCTLWCLANGQPQFIGSTLHVLDLGIDSGAILATAQSPIEENDTHASLVCKAVSTGHDLYEAVLRAKAQGRVLQAVPQEQVGSGRTYLTREWDVWKLARALKYVRSGTLASWVRQGRPGLDEVKLVDVLSD